MASRVMHLAVSSELEKALPIIDANAFRIGHILPDAVLSADKRKVNSHFIKVFDGGRRKCFDFFGFFELFGEKVLGEELYLGYYFHLIEDNIFRIIIYYKLGLLERRGDPRLLEELYGDYHILNGSITEKYSLDRNLFIPQGFSDMTINELYPFELEEFITQLKEDLDEKTGGSPKLFTEAVSEDFLSECVRVCSAEYEALKNGGHYLTRFELSIENRHI